MTHIHTRQSTKGGILLGRSILLKKIPIPASSLVANQIVGIISPIKKKIVNEFKGLGLLQRLASPIIKKVRTDSNIKFIF
jgi:hypothetical protein